MFAIFVIAQIYSHSCEELVQKLNDFNLSSQPPKATYVCAPKPALGKGAFGQVFKILDSATNEPYAMKYQEAKHSTEQNLISGYEKEIKYLTSFDHPNVVGGRHYAKFSDGVTKSYILVMTFVDGMEMTKWMAKSPAPSQAQLDLVMFFLLCGVKYLKQKNLVHLDLKEANIMITRRSVLNPLTSQTEELDVPVIIDFGLATPIGSQMDSLSGTPPYQDIDLVTRFYDYNMADKGVFENANDIYALGEIFYYMVERNYRCYQTSFEERYRQCRLGSITFSQKKNFGQIFMIMKMLSPKIKNRFSVEQLLWLFMETFKAENVYLYPNGIQFDFSQNYRWEYLVSEYKKKGITLRPFDQEEFAEKLRVYFPEEGVVERSSLAFDPVVNPQPLRASNAQPQTNGNPAGLQQVVYLNPVVQTPRLIVRQPVGNYYVQGGYGAPAAGYGVAYQGLPLGYLPQRVLLGEEETEDQPDDKSNQTISLMVFALGAIMVGVAIGIALFRRKRGPHSSTITPLETITV